VTEAITNALLAFIAIQCTVGTFFLSTIISLLKKDRKEKP
jgi:hypothetical protein